MKIIVTGVDLTKDKKRSLIILNHRTRLDWMFIWMLQSRFQILKQLKIVLKAQLKSLPGPGTSHFSINLSLINRLYSRLGDATRRLSISRSCLGKRSTNNERHQWLLQILSDTTLRMYYKLIFIFLFNLSKK